MVFKLVSCSKNLNLKSYFGPIYAFTYTLFHLSTVSYTSLMIYEKTSIEQICTFLVVIELGLCGTCVFTAEYPELAPALQYYAGLYKKRIFKIKL